MEVAREVPIRVETERCKRKLPVRDELDSLQAQDANAKCNTELGVKSATKRCE